MKDEKIGLVLVLAVIGLGLILASLLLPWWGQITTMGTATASAKSISIITPSFYRYEFSTSTNSLVMAIMFIVLSAAIVTGLLIVFLLRVRSIDPSGLVLRLPKICALLAMVFMLLAPLLFLAFPAALNADMKKEAERNDQEYQAVEHNDPTNRFFGSHTEDGSLGRITSRWGGDIGWLFAFLAAGMMAFGNSFLWKSKDKRVHKSEVKQSSHSHEASSPSPPIIRFH